MKNIDSKLVSRNRRGLYPTSALLACLLFCFSSFSNASDSIDKGFPIKVDISVTSVIELGFSRYRFIFTGYRRNKMYIEWMRLGDDQVGPISIAAQVEVVEVSEGRYGFYRTEVYAPRTGGQPLVESKFIEGKYVFIFRDVLDLRESKYVDFIFTLPRLNKYTLEIVPTGRTVDDLKKLRE